jgi:hypothetical protein
MESQVLLSVSFILRIRDVMIWNPGLETFNPERILMIFFSTYKEYSVCYLKLGR